MAECGDRLTSGAPDCPNQHEAIHQRAHLEKTLLDQLLRTRHSAIPRRTTSSPCAASFAQSRLWYIDQLEPGATLYHMQSAHHIIGPLDAAALDRSVNEIIRRHEALRTTFIAPEGQPLQVIATELHMTIPVLDLTGDSSPRASQVQQIAYENLRAPFDLAHGPLLRPALLRLAPEEHVLLLAMHHIISDGWSMRILARELSVLYDAFVRGGPSPLPELPIQYPDFALWQRSKLQGQVLQEQLDFWKKHLSGAPPTLDLPTDRPHPAQQTYDGASLALPVPGRLKDAVRSFSRRQQTTEFMTYLAALAVLLHRYTGSDDLVIGTPIANRPHVDLEHLIGLFVNTLALRLDLSANPTFREMLGRVREVALDAYDHQDLPFEKLVAELHAQRNPGRLPLFQVLFQLSTLARAPLRLTGLTVNRFPVRGGTTATELALSIIQEPQRNELLTTYNTGLFDPATVGRLLAHYFTILEAATTAPDERINSLPLLTPTERELMLVRWNQAASTSPPNACLHQLFETQVEHTPEATALIFKDRRYTYRQLNARANAVARDLIRRGVRPEVPVGILIDYRPEAVLALLAILKAGGAYVPLDPSHPPDRLAFILRDTGIRHVLATEESAHVLPQAGIEPISISLDAAGPASLEASNPEPLVTPDHLAYIIYTSGSTGLPRGVPVPHRGVSNLLASDVATFGLGPGSRVIDVVSLSFDAATCHLLMPLVSGGAVTIVPRESILTPSVLLETIRANAITHGFFPASLLAALPSAELPALRVISVGAEVCSQELVDRWAPGRRFYNVYGPTETSIMATMAECLPGSGKPPIGRPIPNTQAYILDRHLQPVPVGVPGELLVGGIGVSRGYLNRPDLTAERFIPDPFSGRAGARLYRTGDLARYLPDGNIDFLGRTDSQLKVRGFRVEPGEIEAALRQHPAVRQAIVIGHQRAPGEVRLVAYAVLHPQRTATLDELQQHLHSILPHYMAPAALMLLPSMPLTPSGKVDRRALPAPPESVTPASQGFVAPRTAREAELAEVWRQVLGQQEIGVHDNFFDLGGHSLLLMQAIALIEKRWGIRLKPRDFLLQTLAQLAAGCENQAPVPPRKTASVKALSRILQPLKRGARKKQP